MSRPGSVSRFPTNFVWGTATSAYQVEGARTFGAVNIGGSTTTTVSFVVGAD